MAGFYGSARWKRARRQALHDGGWRCSNPECGRSLVGLGKEAHVHHRKALRRAPALAIEPLNLRPFCRDCHMRLEAEERAGPMAAIDGSPTSPDHPWNRDPGGAGQKINRGRPCSDVRSRKLG